MLDSVVAGKSMIAKALAFLLLILAIVWASLALGDALYASSLSNRILLAVWAIGACGFLLGVLATVIVGAGVKP